MVHIDSVKFGQIVIDGKKYNQVLIVNDMVYERDEQKLSEFFGTTHYIGEWEKEMLFQQNPQLIIIGIGQSGELKVDKDFFKQAQKQGIQVISALTPQAMQIYNAQKTQGKRVNALIHTTC